MEPDSVRDQLLSCPHFHAISDEEFAALIDLGSSIGRGVFSTVRKATIACDQSDLKGTAVAVKSVPVDGLP